MTAQAFHLINSFTCQPQAYSHCRNHRLYLPRSDILTLCNGRLPKLNPRATLLSSDYYSKYLPYFTIDRYNCACWLMIGVGGWLQGWIPKQNNPHAMVARVMLGNLGICKGHSDFSIGQPVRLIVHNSGDVTIPFWDYTIIVHRRYIRNSGLCFEVYLPTRTVNIIVGCNR